VRIQTFNPSRRGKSRDNRTVVVSTVSRQLIRARDLADSRYSEPLEVEDLARAANLSRAHFSGQFKRAYGMTPTAYRKEHPPAAAQAMIPACITRVYGRPQYRTFREDSPSGSS